MATALTPVDQGPEPTWEPEAGYALRVRRDRRKKALCDVCKRPIWGEGRLCRGYVNEAASEGCLFWEQSIHLAALLRTKTSRTVLNV